MPTILLFHDVQGLTPGVTAFADTLRAAGHAVHVPDLLDGRKFASIPDGIAYVKTIGFGTVIERGMAAADMVAGPIVTNGMSLGVLSAQAIAQTRGDVRGAVLLDGAVTAAEFSPVWPKHVPVQVHAMDADPEFVDSGDIDAAVELVGQSDKGELFLYPGRGTCLPIVRSMTTTPITPPLSWNACWLFWTRCRTTVPRNNHQPSPSGSALGKRSSGTPLPPYPHPQNLRHTHPLPPHGRPAGFEPAAGKIAPVERF